MRSFLPAFVCLPAFIGLLGAGDEPQFKPDAWLLKFKPLELKSIVSERASGRGRLDWYLLYAVTNDDEAAHPFDLKLTAEVLDSDEDRQDAALAELLGSANRKGFAADIHMPLVEAAVERKLGENFFGQSDIQPYREAFLKAPEGERAAALAALREFLTIKPKETKRCIATFGALDAQADVVKIYVRNLTGTIGVAERDGTRVLEEYVLVLKYKIPGDEFEMARDRFEFAGKRWIKVTREIPGARKDLSIGDK